MCQISLTCFFLEAIFKQTATNTPAWAVPKVHLPLQLNTDILVFQ